MGSGFSFEVVNASDYDELRPSYAPEAVAWVAERGSLHHGSVVVDLAAGTGQLSRRFAPLGVEVIAVEPAANMRAVLRERLPTLRIEDGIAEAMPFADRSADAVVVGNAFHHFDRSVAFAENHRVLRPGGVLALFWAWSLEEEQRKLPAIAAIFEAVERARTSASITAAYRSWAEPPPRAEGFAPFERREFPVTQVIPSSRLAALYATSSDIASMRRSDREELLAEIDRLARELPETLHLPARTVVDLCVRSGDENEAEESG